MELEADAHGRIWRSLDADMEIDNQKEKLQLKFSRIKYEYLSKSGSMMYCSCHEENNLKSEILLIRSGYIVDRVSTERI